MSDNINLFSVILNEVEKVPLQNSPSNELDLSQSSSISKKGKFNEFFTVVVSL